jgi:hypothetical protein
VQGKPVHAGTAAAGEGRALTLVAKPRANTPHLLAGALDDVVAIHEIAKYSWFLPFNTLRLWLYLSYKTIQHTSTPKIRT